MTAESSVYGIVNYVVKECVEISPISLYNCSYKYQYDVMQCTDLSLLMSHDNTITM